MRRKRKKDWTDYFDELMDWFMLMAPIWLAWLAFCAYFV